ncbi:MAG: FHIPEP family type III secretion protein, partial [Phycisphaerales bacterium]|nr:FHIPEP family type III secretion protein [Phycisphaerales bacterium]
MSRLNAHSDVKVSGGFGEMLDRIGHHKHLIVPLAILLLLAVLVVPLPPAILDVLIAANIALAAVILLTTVYMDRPLEFSVFPALLLGATLFRLVLNVASTRLILNADAPSPESAMYMAGNVIESFGTFVAGTSVIVGIIIFSIIVIVQFVVITKGATRMSEVAARFTLDAMPGKQMAIDADLSAGILEEQEARDRRQEVTREADFYGAMDGASKFVRGDAIAGLIITLVNILGGIAIGMVIKGWTFTETVSVFTKLTIGDGLASQIPAFIVAIAAGLIVTRSSGRHDLGTELTQQ